jgi:predicted ATP-binding protein involved in virulence
MNKSNTSFSKFLKPTDIPYLVSLEMENVKCFKEKQILRFADEQNRPYRWTVLLGDNGTGKTTALRSVFMTNQGEYSDKDNFADSLNFQNESSIKVSYVGPNGVESDNVYKAKHGKGFRIKSEVDIVDGLDSYIAYGANRFGEKIGDGRFAKSTLVDDDAKLVNIEQYLIDLDFVYKSKQTKKAEYEFVTINEILKSVLPDVEDIRTNVDKRTPVAEFLTHYGWVRFRDMSLGYQTVAAWIGDLTIRMFETYPNYKNPLAQPAVVLVDEIDLHLHPKWQLNIMDYLSERFPKTQFIVTAHSPLIVQSASNANIIVLKRKGNQVVIDTEVQSVTGWRIDQILGSDLFGSINSREAKVQEKIKRRKELILKNRLSAKEKQELAQLDAEVEALPTAESPEMIQAMNLIRQAAQQLKK